MGPGFESPKVHQKVSAFDRQGPPVPIPNTEVKLCGAENTRREAVREDRARPTQMTQQIQDFLGLYIFLDSSVGSANLVHANRKCC